MEWYDSSENTGHSKDCCIFWIRGDILFFVSVLEVIAEVDFVCNPLFMILCIKIIL